MAAKLTFESVEINQGPRNYATKKDIQALHHQGHVRY